MRDNEISQDIVQEVFVKMWENRSQIESINLEAFLFRLVRNRCIDYIKHLKVVSSRMQEIQISSKYEELYRIDFIGNEPYILIEEELKIKIEKTIHSLPGRCREVFILSRIDGLKNKEIAEKLNINVKNVERHISRALQSFRKNFTEELPLALIVLVLKNPGCGDTENRSFPQQAQHVMVRLQKGSANPTGKGRLGFSDHPQQQRRHNQRQKNMDQAVCHNRSPNLRVNAPRASESPAWQRCRSYRHASGRAANATKKRTALRPY